MTNHAWENDSMANPTPETTPGPEAKPAQTPLMINAIIQPSQM
jgi:hypothetical protein